MVIGNLDNTKEYEGMHPHLPMIFSWLRQNYRSIHSKGVTRIDLIEGEVYANIETVRMKERTEQLMEIHHKYIDVHVPVDMTETIGWELSKYLASPIKPYDKEKDVAFYFHIPNTYFQLRPGNFCIMTPDDGHSPIIGTGTLNKICIKIKI